jgi:hypothetical protein
LLAEAHFVVDIPVDLVVVGAVTDTGH